MLFKSIALLALTFSAVLVYAGPVNPEGQQQQQPPADAQQGDANKATEPELNKQQQALLDQIDKGVKEAAACFEKSNFTDKKCYDKVTANIKIPPN